MTHDMLTQMSEWEFAEVKTSLEAEEYRRNKVHMIEYIKSLAKGIGLRIQLRPDGGVSIPVSTGLSFPLTDEDKKRVEISDSIARLSDSELAETRAQVDDEDYRRYKSRMIAHIKALASDIGLKARLRRDKRVTSPVPVSERVIFF